jgi:predicted O-methyltransferase YrrM
MNESRVNVTAFIENYHREDFFIEQARRNGEESGFYNPSPATCSFLANIAKLQKIKNAVEIGTGSGVGALWLFGAMDKTGVLTSIDSDREAATLTKQILDEASYPAQRYRLITGPILEVAHRLADNNYDLIVIRVADDLLDVIQESHRLLRSNGILIIDNILDGGKVADPTARDFNTIARRDALKALRDLDRWSSTMVNVGEGLIFSIKVDN